ncbi:flagellin [Afipia felis]|uniref:Flagellin n=2 Tax=Afipia felis TaxID=1035 RepID=A0A380W5U7_AFIFE|nr:flagellin [Afipia felis]EKS27544.1 hypothetical protein HMPREF9697_00072 [Afipia felis ATCC 53690]SUU76254.1 flagellin [Afipia felis]SUU84321.1 flagellin [Afipia felis]
MSDIVLTASVRQNLLSLQSTADLLATTQNRLATGKKVNSALDNPTNFFTAASLDARASDINNLLDGIGNGVQVLQAANTGITSLQKLIDSAKSIANQALQTQAGYTKSYVKTGANLGANGSNILGTSTPATPGTVTAGAFTPVNVSTVGTPATTASIDAGTLGTVDLSGAGTISFTVNIDGTNHNITLDNTITAVDKTQVTGNELAAAINAQIGGGSTAASFASGHLTFTSPTAGAGGSVTISGTTGTQAGNSGIADHAIVSGTNTGADSLSFSVTVDGGAAQPVTISSATVAAYNTAHGTSFNSASLSATQIAAMTNAQVGSNVASVSNGNLVFTSPTAGVTSTIAVSAVTTAGATTNTTGIVAANNVGAPSSGGLNGTTLTIASTGGGTATTIVFGTGQGQVSTINQLNAALLPNNLQASIDTTGAITITTSNDAASSTVGALGGSATNPGGPFAGLSIEDPTLDPTSQSTRANLVAQYNNIINQIKTTSQDASFNGVNLLNGDQLKLIFNETGKSTLNITGINLDPAGLGLGTLTAGTDFVDNIATNKVLDALNYASSFLRSQASTLGSNLSIVQIRQDFSKQLINVLQTGSTNLTIADTNEEAANSQALSTRQSIAVSALALANQSQQSVLKLLQ